MLHVFWEAIGRNKGLNTGKERALKRGALDHTILWLQLILLVPSLAGSNVFRAPIILKLVCILIVYSCYLLFQDTLCIKTTVHSSCHLTSKNGTLRSISIHHYPLIIAVSPVFTQPSMLTHSAYPPFSSFLPIGCSSASCCCNTPFT